MRFISMLVAAAAAGALAFPGLAPAGTTAAQMATSASAPVTGQTGTTSAPASPIRHVVVIFLENQTFDSALGFWCRQRPGRCPGGGMPSSVTLSNGVVVTPHQLPGTVPQVDHTVAAQKAAINGGKMNGWQNIKGCGAAAGYACIGGYKPGLVPNLTKLARSFAISDRTFSMAASPSWAGHMAIAAASQNHFYGDNPLSSTFPPPAGWGCDSRRVALWVAPDGTRRLVPSCVPDPSLDPSRYPNGGAFEPTPVSFIPTIMDRLRAARLSWKIYGSVKGQTGYGAWDICPTFAECLDTGQNANLVPDAQFLTSAAAGTLPAFSVVTPGGPDFWKSCHNSGSITACDNWTGQLVQAVMNGPNWASTAIFITFDDCGCFYDQVPPPLAPDGTREGPRVPLIIVSPYARPGYTDTTPTTFTGILAYTEKNFGLAPLSANDASAYSFKNAFNYSQPPLRPTPMTSRPLPPSARHIHVTKAMLNDPT
jgi:phospholipase C